MATNLENKVSDIIGSVIVALKAKGVSNLSVHRIVDYINTRYNVLLDDDVVKDVLSSTAGVAEINDDKVFIGKAPNDEADAENAVNQGKKTFSDQTSGGLSGAPMGGDMGGADMPTDGDMPSSDDMSGDNMSSDMSSSETTGNETADDMDAPLSDLNI